MSIRLTDEVRARLERQASAARERPATYAARVLDEGVRAAAHPGITFRPAPAGGRMAAVVDGPDVAEVVKVVQGLDVRGQARIVETAQWLGLAEHKVRAALDYYAEFTDEIEDELALRADAELQLAARLAAQRDLLG